MHWELYEIWGVDEDSREDLIETTRSLKEARNIAKNSLTESVVEIIIYRDVDGELKEVERLTD